MNPPPKHGPYLSTYSKNQQDFDLGSGILNVTNVFVLMFCWEVSQRKNIQLNTDIPGILVVWVPMVWIPDIRHGRAYSKPPGLRKDVFPDFENGDVIPACYVSISCYVECNLSLYLPGFIHPRWLRMGFLNHQQYGRDC